MKMRVSNCRQTNMTDEVDGALLAKSVKNRNIEGTSHPEEMNDHKLSNEISKLVNNEKYISDIVSIFTSKKCDSIFEPMPTIPRATSKEKATPKSPAKAVTKHTKAVVHHAISAFKSATGIPTSTNPKTIASSGSVLERTTLEIGAESEADSVSVVIDSFKEQNRQRSTKRQRKATNILQENEVRLRGGTCSSPVLPPRKTVQRKISPLSK